MLDMSDNMNNAQRALSKKNNRDIEDTSVLSLTSISTAKLIMDYTIAVTGLLLFLPASLMIALLIKLTSRGSVLVRQQCLCRDNRVFDLFKFRTVTIDMRAARSGACEYRKKVTHIGRFLQRSGLDELPNFINVLRGEMSIVGPRPHALIHSAYHSSIERYSSRHRVKPGITGWAQIHGYAGDADSLHLMTEQVRYDLDYVTRWSPWLDLKIIALTLPYSLFRKRR